MLEKVEHIFQEVFRNQNLIITSSTSAKDIKSWDSLTHLELIASIEEAFNIRFSFDEVMTFNTVGDMINAIKKNKSV